MGLLRKLETEIRFAWTNNSTAAQNQKAFFFPQSSTFKQDEGDQVTVLPPDFHQIITAKSKGFNSLFRGY